MINDNSSVDEIPEAPVETETFQQNIQHHMEPPQLESQESMSTIEEEQEPKKPKVFRIIALCVALILFILVAIIVATTQVLKNN